MAKTRASFLLTLLLLASARADWSVASSEAERSSAASVEHRRIILVESGTDEHVTLNLALFSAKSATLRVIDNPNGAALATVMQREHCLAGVNGGYFDPENAPLGLTISDGRPIAPLRRAKLLSGIIIVTSSRVQLLRTAEYSPARKTVVAALQCGPFLVDHSRPVPGLNDTRAARRTFVATEESGRAAIGVASEATLAQLGEILATNGSAGDLKVRRALNLDGGSSSAFWIAESGGPFSISEQKTVRNFVAVTPK